MSISQPGSSQPPHLIHRSGIWIVGCVAALILGAAAAAFLAAPAAAQDGQTGVEIVTNVTNDPTASVEYLLAGPPGFRFVNQSSGDSQFIALRPGERWFINELNNPTLYMTGVECTDDAGGATVPGFIRDVDLQLAAGVQAVCTFTFIKTGTAELIVVFESEDPAAELVLGDPLRGSTITMSPGDSFSRTTHPEQAALHPTSSFTSPGGLVLSGACLGDLGTMSIGLEGLSGRAPVGANVTCTFTAAPEPGPTITLVTDVRGVLDPSFSYSLVGEGLDEVVTQGREDSTTITVPADVPISLSSEPNGNWLTGMWCADVLGATTYGAVPGVDAEVTLSFEEDLTCTYSHTLDQTGVAYLAINAPDFPNDPFEFFTSSFGGTRELNHGEGVILGNDLRFQTWIHPDPVIFDLVCTGTDPDPFVLEYSWEVDVSRDVAAGEVAVCVLEVTSVGTTRFNFELNAAHTDAAVFVSSYDTIPIALTAAEGGFGYAPAVAKPAFRLTSWTSGFDVFPRECAGDDVSFADFGAEPIPRSAELLVGSPVAGTTVTCTLDLRPSFAGGLNPTVTCLGGNGRIDMNVLNGDTVAHLYRVEIGTLSPRSRTVAAADWWRSPVTGRADGPIDVRVLRDNQVIFDSQLVVDCDDASPTVSAPEVEVLNACRGGNGFVAWQFANPTDAQRGYVIEFDGVPNRSTSAAAFGASVRAVSGRADGTYGYSIRASGAVVDQGSVVVQCDAPVQ